MYSNFLNKKDRDQYFGIQINDDGVLIMGNKKNEHNCSLIIALTHMRLPRDKKFATECPGVDMVLGGHDHFYKITAINQ